MALINCFECDRRVSDKAASCPNCGAPVSTAFACPIGASPVRRLEAVQIGKSRRTAVPPVILFGGIGIHKFFIDRLGWSILYFAFCWKLIPAVVGFIEGLLYLTIDDNQFQAKYGYAVSPVR